MWYVLWICSMESEGKEVPTLCTGIFCIFQLAELATSMEMLLSQRMSASQHVKLGCIMETVHSMSTWETYWGPQKQMSLGLVSEVLGSYWLSMILI